MTEQLYRPLFIMCCVMSSSYRNVRPNRLVNLIIIMFSVGVCVYSHDVSARISQLLTEDYHSSSKQNNNSTQGTISFSILFSLNSN